MEDETSEVVLHVDPSFFDDGFEETEIKFELDDDLKLEIQSEGEDITIKPEIDNISIKPDIIDAKPDKSSLEPEVLEIEDDDETSSDSEDESFFHCPFCSFKSQSQIGMGEHVMGKHEGKWLEPLVDQFLVTFKS